jgi:hypothetical protein
VAAPLAVSLVADALEDANRLAGRDARELAQTATSTSSSWMDGGIGSSRSLRLSR